MTAGFDRLSAVIDRSYNLPDSFLSGLQLWRVDLNLRTAFLPYREQMKILDFRGAIFGFEVSYQSFQGFGFLDEFNSLGPGERARLGRTATRPRGAIGKILPRGSLTICMSGAGRTRRHPRAGALPGTGRYRATIQRSKSIQALVSAIFHNRIGVPPNYCEASRIYFALLNIEIYRAGPADIRLPFYGIRLPRPTHSRPAMKPV